MIIHAELCTLDHHGSVISRPAPLIQGHTTGVTAHTSLLLFSHVPYVPCSRWLCKSRQMFVMSHMAVSRLSSPLIYALADLFALVFPLPKQLPARLLRTLPEVDEPAMGRHQLILMLTRPSKAQYAAATARTDFVTHRLSDKNERNERYKLPIAHLKGS